MKQLLFLLLFPCFALAQYQGNANQKITLGEQTTADGLVYRGVASIDTVRATSKITRTNKQDTSAFLLLDTVTNLLWHYKTASNGWIQAGGSTFDTTTLNLVSRFALKLNISDTSSMLTNYYRSGRALGTPTSGILTNATGLPISTGLTGLGAANRIPYASSTTALTTSSGLTFDGTNFATTGTATATRFNPTSTDSTGNGMFLPAANTLGFSINGTNKMTINSNGNVVIGAKIDPGFKFLVAGTDNNNYFGTYNTTTASSLRFQSNQTINYMTSALNPLQIEVGGQIRMAIKTDGNVGFGENNPSEKLHVVGNAKITAVGAGTFANNLNITSDGTLTTATSDEKYKYNILPINYGLNTILKLKPVNFQWVEGEENDLGFIAQDVAEIIPEAVNTNWNSDLLMRYESIIPILTKAIQEQQALIKALEQRLLILENK